MFPRWILYPLFVIFAGGLAATLFVGFIATMVWPTLPSLESLTDYKPKIPLRIYSAEGLLIGEFGEERRDVVAINQVPKAMVDAILAAEDERFYQHNGVDYIGLARAALANFISAGARQGASTITMQVARNFFLSREKTLTRKLNEILLAFKIEANLNKAQILELYINQIYLGQRAYGFAAASRTYFGKPLNELSLAEIAVLAGLPKAPSSFNPVVNPSRAKLRQQYVLRRMREMGSISTDQEQAAVQLPLRTKNEIKEFATHAEYIAEMVRQKLVEQYHEAAYVMGLNVYTTIRVRNQTAAYEALRKGVQSYDRRHGYRGPEGFVDLNADYTEEDLEEALQEHADSDEIHAAVVVEANPKHIRAYRRGGWIDLYEGGLIFAASALDSKASTNRRIRRGAIIRVQLDDKKRWAITQMPLVESTIVSADPKDGAILALVGGFDFKRTQYNHTTQALRQPGSSFKPFIYSAALEKGISPASIFNDAPLQLSSGETGSEPWEPKNFEGTYEGPISMRTALIHSKNLVSIRILQSIGTQYAQDYITKFGFDAKLHPPYLTMALGAGSATPLQMLVGYSVFANGGFRINPYLISRIEDNHGKVLFEEKPVRANLEAERAIDARNAYVMSSMMRDVIRAGTGASAKSLGRGDLGGKTGTTNDFLDGWFCGYNSNVVTITWLGYDQPQTLGHNETGASVALPIWIQYMATALSGMREEPLEMPPGIIQTNGELYFQEFSSAPDSESPLSAPPNEALRKP